MNLDNPRTNRNFLLVLVLSAVALGAAMCGTALQKIETEPETKIPVEARP